MCFCIPSHIGIEIDHVARTPHGKKIVKTTSYGYTGRREKLSRCEEKEEEEEEVLYGHRQRNALPRYPLLMPPPPPLPAQAENVLVFDAHPDRGYTPPPPPRAEFEEHRYPQPPGRSAPRPSQLERPRAGLPPGVAVGRRNAGAAAAARPRSGIRYGYGTGYVPAPRDSGSSLWSYEAERRDGL